VPLPQTELAAAGGQQRGGRATRKEKGVEVYYSTSSK